MFNLRKLLMQQQQQVRHVLAALITTLLYSCSSRDNLLIRALEFEHPTFESPQDVANITFVTQDWYTDGPNASYSQSALWLTPASGINASLDPTNLGRIVYKDPILFFSNNDNTFLSFNTSFTFQIITTAPDGQCGSGMAFFISQTLQAPDNSDTSGSLGLRNPDTPTPAEAANRFFAVEFDTHLSPNYKDPSYSHIGIDINSLVSSNTTDTTKGNPFYPDLYLYSNYTFIAWIEYSASSNLIQVWMSNINTTTSHQRPAYPCLQLHYDLSTLFLQRIVYVGFSATSAPQTQGIEGHAIYSWNFSNSEPFSNVTANRSNHVTLRVALGAALGGGLLALMVLCAGVYMWKVRRRRRPYRPINDNNNIQAALMTVPRYSYTELKRATQGFNENNKAGEGGFSSVYRGTLADGCVVAVKKLKESVRREAEFCAEMGIISRIRHRYLLELHGWCYENGEALLVYKFMANGSLDRFLFGKKKGALGSETRLRILKGVAAALEYLHGGLGDCVLHRDVKAANVLLTDELEPKLSDFGLARLIGHDQMVSMTVAGTPGHVAPELVYKGRATEKADVYSFGVLALEVACGRRACMQDEHLVDWVWLLHEADDHHSRITDALDPSILADVAAHHNVDDEEQSQLMQVKLLQWKCVLHVALMCCHPSPESRPSMRQVTQALHDGVQLLPLPTTRPTFYSTTTSTNTSVATTRSALASSASSLISTTAQLGSSTASTIPTDSESLAPR